MNESVTGPLFKATELCLLPKQSLISPLPLCNHIFPSLDGLWEGDHSLSGINAPNL